jgi:hypothetical protein
MSAIILAAGFVACALVVSAIVIFVAMPDYPWQGEEGV